MDLEVEVATAAKSNPDQLLAAIRDSFDGLTPAFGMKGTNKAVILVDCSETMVEAYRNTTRIEMVIASLQEFLLAPLIRSYPVQRSNTWPAAGGFANMSRREPPE